MLTRSLILPLLLLATACSGTPETTASEGSSDAIERARSLNAESMRSLDEARRLAEKRKAKTVCDDDSDLATQRAVLTSLQSAIKADERARPVVASDALLRETLGDNLYFQSLTGALDEDLTKLGSVLPGQVFYGPAPGAFGNMSRIEFQADGQLRFLYLTFDPDGQLLERIRVGTWKLEAVRFRGEPAQDIRLVLDDDGRTYILSQDPAALEYRIVPVTSEPTDSDFVRGKFTTSPSECEA